MRGRTEVRAATGPSAASPCRGRGGGTAPAWRPCAGCHSTAIPTVDVGTVPLGVYVGSGEPRGVARFAAATGAKPSLASDYLPRTDGWAGMVEVKPLRPDPRPRGGERVPARARRSHDPHPKRARRWGRWRKGRPGATTPSSRRSPGPSCPTARANAILRLGWEFNGTWYPWAVTDPTDAADFAAYFRNIVTAMRLVPGHRVPIRVEPDVGIEP